MSKKLQRHNVIENKKKSFFLYFSVITYSSAHSCYVCGNGADEPFTKKDQLQSKGSSSSTSSRNKNTSMISSNCDEFERGTDDGELAKFIWECPSNYLGCSVEIDGKSLIFLFFGNRS